MRCGPLVVWGVCLAGCIDLLVASHVRGAEPKRDSLSYVDNGTIKVGANLSRGGSIGYLADVKKGGNVVNIHDLGRWIGQSYYAGPKPFGTPHPAWKDWPWNPVSAGDVYGNPSRLVEHKNDGTSLYIKAIPMQWALNGVPGDCELETWLKLEGRAVHVRNRLTNKRQDTKQYRAMDQELPAVYTVGTLHRLKIYTGDTPFAHKPLTTIPKRPAKDGKPAWATFDSTEHWAALVDDDDWGLGVIHSGVVRFLGGFYGNTTKGGPTDDPTGYIAPVRQEILDHNIVYEYRYTLVLDTLDGIRKEAYKQQPATAVPDTRFKNDRQHWWFTNAEDAGQPITGCLRLKLEQDDPQLIGPEGCWAARDAPSIYIRAAFRTESNTAEVYWETADRPGFAANQKVAFTVVPDGRYRTYEVPLSTVPTYRGMIRRLRFDPTARGTKGDMVEIEFIATKKE